MIPTLPLTVMVTRRDTESQTPSAAAGGDPGEREFLHESCPQLEEFGDREAGRRYRTSFKDFKRILERADVIRLLSNPIKVVQKLSPVGARVKLVREQRARKGYIWQR